MMYMPMRVLGIAFCVVSEQNSVWLTTFDDTPSVKLEQNSVVSSTLFCLQAATLPALESCGMRQAALSYLRTIWIKSHIYRRFQHRYRYIYEHNPAIAAQAVDVHSCLHARAVRFRQACPISATGTNTNSQGQTRSPDFWNDARNDAP